MDEQRTIRVSRYLSRHLRHQPDRIGLTLDPAGWADIDELITAAARHGFPLTREELARVVETNARRGRPVVLTVDAAAMHRDGHVFHRSANGVWLTAAVPPRHLRFPGPR
ncbi:RNA 2'-phosphotransferase [Streptomyces misionensis]|uniref:RNA 2'-phosphotransferase n=1 Tax=Streptomyces misionensis TaxID=67331 RepID=UPI00396BB3B6